MHRLLVEVGLGFPSAEDERRFFSAFILSQKVNTQISLALGGALFYVFFLWDQIIDPVNGQLTHAIRGLGVTPAAFIIAVLLSNRAVSRYYEAVVTFALMIPATGLTIIYAILAEGYNYGAIGIVLVIFFAFTMTVLRFAYYLVFCLLCWPLFNLGQYLADNAQDGMFLVNNLSIGAAVFLGLYSAAVRELSQRKKYRADAELSDARERIDELLHSMLPREIVDRIQAGEQAIADAHGEVSIVFADLVNFTALSRQLSARKLVDILNQLFSRFDAEADLHGVEKIKTIGDAYMAVSGLSEGSGDHAEKAADFAFAMHRVVKEMSVLHGFPIDIRVGLHVGPIVSGVIGTKRPAFDCWGEAVNVASRLEHTAAPGGILISEAAHWRLRGSFDTTALEEIELKGLGLSKVYLLRPRNAGESAHPAHALVT